jgi:hypothetical protein
MKKLFPSFKQWAWSFLMGGSFCRDHGIALQERLHLERQNHIPPTNIVIIDFNRFVLGLI